MINLTIIGNCHAPALAWYMSELGQNVNAKPIVAHELSPNQNEQVSDKIHKSDIVLHFPISNQYHIEAVREQNVKAATDGNSQTFTNLYFTGLQPDATYIGPSAKRVRGVLGEYHSRITVWSYRKGYNVSQTINLFQDPEFAKALGYEKTWNNSKESLQSRRVEVNLSEIFFDSISKDLPLFTFNHPTTKILAEFSQRLLKSIDIQPTQISPTLLPNWFWFGPIFPVLPYIDKFHGIDYTSTLFKEPGAQGLMSLEEYISKSFALYKTIPPSELRIEDETAIGEAYHNVYGEHSEPGTNVNLKHFSQKTPVHRWDFEKAKSTSLIGTPLSLEKIERVHNAQSIQFMADMLPIVRKLYPQESHTISVLDVGARTAAGTAFLQMLHHPHGNSKVKMQVTALDIDDSFKEYAKISFPDLQYQKEDIFNIKNQKWDLVICSHTIEHVPDPHLFLKQLQKLARDYVLISTPYKEDPNNLIPGHCNSIDDSFIDKFSPVQKLIYDGMYFRQSDIVIFAIRGSENIKPELINE